MKALVLVVALISILPVRISLKLNRKAIGDFMEHFNSNCGIIFYCEPLNIDVWSETVKNDFTYFSFFDVSSTKFNLSEAWDMMRFDSHPLAVIWDLTCNETAKIFDEFSRFKFFNASYNWLMMSDEYESSIEVLRYQNINLDAEITIAIIEDDPNSFKLHDIYNPSARTNGKIVVQPKGLWTENAGLNITLKGGKFDLRSNLNGIFIHAGIVATKVQKNQTLAQYLEGKVISH